MDKFNLMAISPIDGRYISATEPLKNYFSEFALIKARLAVEIEYFIALSYLQLPHLPQTGKDNILRKIYSEFVYKDALRIKEIENITNHDVKAIEYYLKFDIIGLKKYREFVHFGLTSQDINNTAIPLLLKKCIEEIIIPTFYELINKINYLSMQWRNISMLARTHGQPATPTTMGKEMKIFAYRLENQLNKLKNIDYSAKFGGATGNFNAHIIAYPNVDWEKFADNFIFETFQLKRLKYTTQIDNYDHLAELFDCLSRLNTILINFSRDIWLYIMQGYFKQYKSDTEIGSSTMPHKINPIDFENAEGNLLLANSLFKFMSQKLPISRLQRDLSDSTVIRNIGVPLSHILIALSSISKGLSKLIIDEDKIAFELENHWEVITEAIQTILRREGFSEPYEKLNHFIRKNNHITKKDIHKFIDDLQLPDNIKTELKNISPSNYIGIANKIS